MHFFLLITCIAMFSNEFSILGEYSQSYPLIFYLIPDMAGSFWARAYPGPDPSTHSPEPGLLNSLIDLYFSCISYDEAPRVSVAEIVPLHPPHR